MLYSTAAALALFSIIPVIAAGPAVVQTQDTGVRIRADQSDNMCLSTTPKDGPSDGTLLSLRDCGILMGGSTSNWIISPGSGSVILAGNHAGGKTFALDAGNPLVEGSTAKIWTSYPGLMQQTWYLTDDNHIAITDGTQCLGIKDDLPVIYECTPGDKNQVWHIGSA